MKRMKLLGVIMCVAWSSLACGSTGVAIAPKFGTTGIGGDLVLNLNDTLNVRIGGAGLSVSPHMTLDDIKYDVDIDLLTFNAMLDWHAFRTPFRFSAGIIVNQNEVDFVATPTGTVTIGGQNYTAANVGTLNGHVEYDRAISPYLGLGYNSAFTKNGRFGFYSDLGVYYADSAQVTLSATGVVASVDLRGEEERIQDDLDDWQFYPVICFGFYFRF